MAHTSHLPGLQASAKDFPHHCPRCLLNQRVVLVSHGVAMEVVTIREVLHAAADAVISVVDVAVEAVVEDKDGEAEEDRRIASTTADKVDTATTADTEAQLLLLPTHTRLRSHNLLKTHIFLLHHTVRTLLRFPHLRLLTGLPPRPDSCRRLR